MTINLKYDGKTYPLTYTRESVRRMENAGFDIQEFANGKRPATLTEQLFEGAFMAQNRKVSRKVISEIFEHIEDKTDLVAALVEMYANTLSSLIGDETPDDGKKASWEAV